MKRRDFIIGCGFLSLGMLVAPVPGYGLLTGPAVREKRISLYNLHTGESLERHLFYAEGKFLPEGLEQLNRLLRDYRTGEVCDIDPKLFGQLWTIQQKFQSRSPFHIISGYRCPTTNQALRQKSGGVAKNSLHTKGKAIDIRLPGVELGKLRKVALSMKKGGVGYYPQDNFVHIDTGRVRFW